MKEKIIRLAEKIKLYVSWTISMEESMEKWKTSKRTSIFETHLKHGRSQDFFRGGGTLFQKNFKKYSKNFVNNFVKFFKKFEKNFKNISLQKC